jgi:hypothetical protein
MPAVHPHADFATAQKGTLMFKSLRTTAISGLAAMAMLAGSALPMLTQSAHAGGEIPLSPAQTGPIVGTGVLQLPPKLTASIQYGPSATIEVKGSGLPANSTVSLVVSQASTLVFPVTTNASGGFSFSMAATCGTPDTNFRVHYSKNGAPTFTNWVTVISPACP